MNWSQIESKMKWLWGYIKKLLNVLYKGGCGISYAWFLFPVVFWFSYVKTWQHMNSDPHTTDLYLGINLLAMNLVEGCLNLLYIVANVLNQILLKEECKHINKLRLALAGYLVLYNNLALVILLWSGII